MGRRVKLNEKGVKDTYQLIKRYHQRYLKKHGVKLPKLKNKGGYTKDALTLVYLANGYPRTRKVSKTELTKFIRGFYPEVNDVRQARHLGAQKGWWIVAGGRDNAVRKVERGFYQLHTLAKPYPAYHGHRAGASVDFEKIKSEYDNRCVTCGSKEGERNIHWPGTITKLQKAHMDPNKPLAKGNIIPQCQKCNRGDRNRWVYDERGRVIKIANHSVVKSCNKEVRKKIYRLLYKEFKGRDPDERDKK